MMMSMLASPLSTGTAAENRLSCELADPPVEPQDGVSTGAPGFQASPGRQQGIAERPAEINNATEGTPSRRLPAVSSGDFRWSGPCGPWPATAVNPRPNSDRRHLLQMQIKDRDLDHPSATQPSRTCGVACSMIAVRDASQGTPPGRTK
jgi:hypothetical protein